MKILITGTAGFIGFHLARRLIERGDTVVGIDNINDYYDVELKYAVWPKPASPGMRKTGIPKYKAQHTPTAALCA
jgi:nucleoside-diphosphate-sugar epimerase